MKIAIGFFGITRSLKYTIKSIEQNILNIFKNNNIDYDIFIHTYELSNYKNIRTEEVIQDSDIDNEEYKLLNANFIQIDNQENVKDLIDLKKYRTHKDPWNTNYNAVDFFILAQYSKLQLTNMIDNQMNNANFKYDYVLFMRPDCMYVHKFPINILKHVKKNNIVIPNFHTHGPHRFNDRFSITNMKSYKIYGEIFKRLFYLSKKQPLHSETIIGQIVKNNNLNIIRVPFYFARIRFKGVWDKYDVLELKGKVDLKDFKPIKTK
jgi:hypothetical protein